MMNTANAIYHFMRADFLERVRRNSFFIVLGLTLFVGYLLVPPLDAPYVTFMRGFYRGVYNSAWIGVLFGTVSVTFLPLFGFYLVKNALDRDYQTQVGQIIATTPISKPTYLLGKTLSNLAVLCAILLVLTIMAVTMQFVRAEALQLDLWAIAAPIWLLGLPVLAGVAAIAVLFESIPLLRGGLGNVVYFFLFMVVVIGGWMPSFFSQITPKNDFLGLSRSTAAIQQSILAHDPEADMGTGGLMAPKTIMGETLLDEEISIFVWDGMEWSARIIFERALWLLLPFSIASLAAIPFDRFDPARRGRATRPRKNGSPLSKPQPASDEMAATIVLTPLPEQRFHWRFGAVLLAELRLMLKGKRWGWYAGVLGIIIVGLAVPLDYALSYLLPFAWIWPLLIWSSMGVRETRHFTGPIIFSAPHILTRQLPAIWLAGALVALLMASGVGARLLLAGDFAQLLALLVGALFIPALALTLGTWSGSSRLFEIVYLVWWYLLVNGISALDFMGITDNALSHGLPLTYLGLTFVCMFAVVLRRRGF